MLSHYLLSLLVTIYIYIVYYGILYYIFSMVHRKFPIKKSIFFNFGAWSVFYKHTPYYEKFYFCFFYIWTRIHVHKYSNTYYFTLFTKCNNWFRFRCQQSDQSNNSSKGQSCELINLTRTPNHLDNNFFIWASYVLTHWFIPAESKFYNIYIWENQN